MSRKHALLALDMRLGKTGCTIRAAHQLGAKTVAVVCPAIAVPHWQREFEKWWPSGPLPLFKIASYERWTALWDAGLQGSCDAFVVDEAHYAKNPDAKRTRMVYGKTGIAQRAGVTWALTGTPMLNHPGELWPMLFAFGVVGMPYSDFVARYCVVNAMTGRVVGMKTKYVPELRALLATVTLRKTRKEVAHDMPEIGFEFLEMEPVGLDLAPDAEARIDAGPLATDTEDRIAVARAKADELAKEVQAAIGNGLLKQTIIFGHHKAPLRQLHDDLQAAGISTAMLTGGTSPAEREAVQDRVREGAVQAVCANIIAAGTAIDLSAASHGYFVELDWTGQNNVQAANRLVSMTKDERVTFDICTWPGTVDDRVQRTVLRKMQSIRALGL